MLILATVLFAVAFGTGLLAVYQILVRDRDPVVTRLRDLRARALAHGPIRSPSGRTSSSRAWPPWADSPNRREHREPSLRPRARGDPRAAGGAGFPGSKIVLAVVLSLGWVSVNYALARPIGSTVVQGGIAAVVGFYLPTIWLYLQGRNA